MSRRILSALAATIFCICLLLAADMKKNEEIEIQNPQQISKKNTTVLAELDEELLGNSFTTESGNEIADEKTYIERKDITLVTTQADIYDVAEPVMLSVDEESEKARRAVAREGMLSRAFDDQTIKAAYPGAERQSAVQQPEEEPAVEVDGQGQPQAQEDESVPAINLINNRWNIALSEDEINLLAKIVWLEANGEPVEGQQAVVEVVFNRMASGLFPDSLYDVLSQKNPVQFCSWKNVGIAKPTEKEYDSIRHVLNGESNLLRTDTVYFSTTPLTSHTDVRIGGHSFCY